MKPPRGLLILGGDDSWLLRGRPEEEWVAGVEIITSTKCLSVRYCVHTRVVLCARSCPRWIFFFYCEHECVFNWWLWRSLSGAVLAAAFTCTHNASHQSITEGKTMACEVISVQPHPPGSNCAARYVKENQWLCEETVKPWEHRGSDNFNW